MLHLHQYRLVCAIGVCYTRGAECTRCHGRDTLPGVRLRCRGSLPEAAAYGAALALWQHRLVAQADALIVPSRFARERLRALGAPLPWERVHVLPPPVRALSRTAPSPRSELTESQTAGSPRRPYALVVARLAPEKGVDVAIDACRLAGIAARGGRRRSRAAGAARAGRRRRRVLRRDVSMTPSWLACARMRRSRSCLRARPRRSGWPPPRRWPPGCPSPPAPSGRFQSCSTRWRWRRPATRPRSRGAIARVARRPGRRAAWARARRRGLRPAMSSRGRWRTIYDGGDARTRAA